MRVPDGLQVQMLTKSLAQATARMQRYQLEVASGLRIQRPSDDPAGTQRAANLRTGLSKVTQYTTTTNDAQAWLKSEDTALGTMEDTLRQIRNYGLQGNNPTTAEGRDTLAQQIKTAAGTLKQALNSTDGMRSLFSGNQTTSTPFQGTPPAGVTYQGDTGVRRIEIGDGITLNLNHSGEQVANLNSSTDAALPDMFTTIDQLMTAVQNNDSDGISSGIQELDKHLTRLTTLRAETGVKLQQTDLALDQLSQQKVSLTELLSNTEDADITESLVHLKEQENLYQAATYVSSTLGQGGLLDWLR